MFTGSAGATCQWTCPATSLHVLRVLIDCVMLPDVHRISWSNMSMKMSNYRSSHTTCVNRLCCLMFTGSAGATCQWTCPTTSLHILRVLIDCAMLPDVHRISWSNMSMNMSSYKSSHTTCVNRLCNVAWCSQDQLEQHVNEHVQLQVFTYYVC